MNRSTATTNDAAMRRLAAQPYRETMGLRRQAAICFVAPPRRTRCPLYAIVAASRICQPGARNAGHARFKGGL